MRRVRVIHNPVTGNNYPIRRKTITKGKVESLWARMSRRRSSGKKK